MSSRVWMVAIVMTTVMVATVAAQNKPSPPGTKSVGRGWPVAVEARDLPAVGPGLVGGRRGGGPGAPGAPAPAGRAGAPGAAPAQAGRGGAPGAGAAAEPTFNGLARNGATPPGIEPLKIDIFTSKDYYKDKDLYLDKRYYRCNSPFALEAQWGAYGSEIIGPNGPATAAWGHCDRDIPREALVSPYPFKTAQEHYQALMAETKAKGGPTQHTYATVPGEWTGRYANATESWIHHTKLQTATMMSLLTPEYRTRQMQENYHQANTNVAHWPSQYCWPEGFMRRWHQASVREHQIIVSPQLVQILAGVARNFVTNIYVGRQFNTEGLVPRLGADVPRWYGETIGFWDGDALITWTSNVQSWKSHAMFEHSNKMQSVEIYTPMRDAAGALSGLQHEAILYDPDAFLEPVRIVRDFRRLSGPDQGDPYTYIECVQTIFPVNGKATPLSPGATFTYEVLDMFGRPWSTLWEKYYEKDMEKPVAEDLFDFSK
jgi:hypothetical protein